MSSGHWQNTGLAKWISDNLYQYNTSDEKSMNPMKWHSIQNGGNLSDTRETINGFPCRLILINDGETPLNEGQNEPTPGNVKDMGIFNFNNDKGNTDTFGLDNKIFPRCISYEVVANSDTSAGAFVPYIDSNPNLFESSSSEFVTGLTPDDMTAGVTVEKTNSNSFKITTGSRYSYAGAALRIQTEVGKTYKIKCYGKITYGKLFIGVLKKNTGWKSSSCDLYLEFTATESTTDILFYAVESTISENNKIAIVEYNNVEIREKVVESNELELAYLQDSFELRYPDDKEVGADYGMLGMDIDNSGTLNSEYGLKRVIDWVGNATNEEFVANFEQYFNKEYTFRYYLLVIALGMVDNLGGRSCRV